MPTKEIFEKVQDDARRRITGVEARTSNLFVENEVLPGGEIIQIQDAEISMEIDTLMVFSDDAPTANWAHPCRYLLYNADDGELYKEVPARFPPYLLEPPESFEMFHEAVPLNPDQGLRLLDPSLRYVTKVPKGERYAVLFSGASNFRHVNDLEFAYRTLVDVYGFKADNIYVLNYNGTIAWSKPPYGFVNWPGDNTPYRMPVHGAGTKADLEGVFNDLKTRLNYEDLLVIHTNNHGGRSSESFLCTYSGPFYRASDFAAKLGELPRFRCLITMFEQCHSGGFNPHVISASPATRTSVASACDAFSSSYGGPHFDHFARDWIAALNDADPYGGLLASNPDLDSDGCIAAKEAFDFAETHKYFWDSPVYSETPVGGGGCHLGQLYHRWWPVWYRELLYERPLFDRPPLPDPALYETIHQKLLPELAELDNYMAERYMELGQELQEEIGPQVEEMIEATLGYTRGVSPEPAIS